MNITPTTTYAEILNKLVQIAKLALPEYTIIQGIDTIGSKPGDKFVMIYIDRDETMQVLTPELDDNTGILSVISNRNITIKFNIFGDQSPDHVQAAFRMSAVFFSCEVNNLLDSFGLIMSPDDTFNISNEPFFINGRNQEKAVFGVTINANIKEDFDDCYFDKITVLIDRADSGETSNIVDINNSSC